MSYLVGIDGGGTRTTLALADLAGRELLRRTGPAGLVDPRRPAATAEMLAELVRDTAASAGLRGPGRALCAGLAGVGNPSERDAVQEALRREAVAGLVRIRSDGEIALHGAFAGEAGLLLVAGTGSVAYGRAEDGRIERCGGWGMVVGDEGSGFAIGRAALTAALRSVDGRGPETSLLPVLLHALGLPSPDSVPPWAGKAAKSDIAALAVHALREAEKGDGVALDLVRGAASQLAEHAAALARRLAPWSAPVPVVFHGGTARDPIFSHVLRERIARLDLDLQPREAQADAVTGAVRLAREALASEQPRTIGA